LAEYTFGTNISFTDRKNILIFRRKYPIQMRNQNWHRSLMAISIWRWFLFFCVPLVSSSQTTNISGVVNTYHSVVEVIPSKACVRVSSTAGLTPSVKVLLIQMKGASLNTTSNTTAFGDTVSLNNAGNYEVGTICAIVGDSVFLVHTILNTYTPGTGKVQLVKFAEYVSANVIGTVTATGWNNSTGTGGVIAIFAEQDITLNSDINADANGFRGGIFAQSNTFCNNSYSAYFYDGAPSFFLGQSGAYKGEGIADVTASISGGRGAFGNGGGGGNNHNNGGGGGANLGAGGLGGGNSTDPEISNCTASFPGEGGKPLSNWAGRKIFLGGGGGAGHNNNVVTTTPGANGGGIIFIHAANLIGNGRSITAAGGVGSNSQADGAGGGGGGGTIILDIAGYSGALTVRADGGQGGDSNDALNIGRCYGAGGGGGGGALYFSGALPTATISSAAGAAGLEYNREATCEAPKYPNAGTAGQTTTGYAYRASSTLASYCSIVLPVRITSFRATAMNSTITLDWRLPNASDGGFFIIERAEGNGSWSELESLPMQNGSEAYSALDKRPLSGYNSYRIKIVSAANAISYSSVRHVFFNIQSEKLNIYPNPAFDKITIAGITGTAVISVREIAGKIVFEKSVVLSQVSTISLPRLKAGVYVMTVNGMVRKIIIN
jgi:hypothetical protein